MAQWGGSKQQHGPGRALGGARVMPVLRGGGTAGASGPPSRLSASLQPLKLGDFFFF